MNTPISKSKARPQIMTTYNNLHPISEADGNSLALVRADDGSVIERQGNKIIVEVTTTTTTTTTETRKIQMSSTKNGMFSTIKTTKRLHRTYKSPFIDCEFILQVIWEKFWKWRIWRPLIWTTKPSIIHRRSNIADKACSSRQSIRGTSTHLVAKLYCRHQERHFARAIRENATWTQWSSVVSKWNRWLKGCRDWIPTIQRHQIVMCDSRKAISYVWKWHRRRPQTTTRTKTFCSARWVAEE